MNPKTIILNRLLDKYERSKAYLHGKTTRRIMLRLCSGDMPEYDLGNTRIRELINSTVQGLAKAGIVKYEWMKFERGNIIDRVWLCIDSVEDAYREAKRTPKKEKAELVSGEIRKALPGIKQLWIKEFLEEALGDIDKNKSITPHFPGDTDTALSLIYALVEIDSLGGEECSERVFSIKCFGGSKYFERNVKKKIAGIIGKYLLGEKDTVERPADEEMLAQVGIVKVFGQVEFCGDILGNILGKPIDFSIFPHGIAMNSHTVKGLSIEDVGLIKSVLFIENKTNYMEYVLNKKTADELVIYHGGFYSPIKGEFFKKVYERGRRAGVKFYHWGDIDIGGFRMYRRLKENIIPDLKPYRMDRAAFVSKEKYHLPINKRYQRSLEAMLKDDSYAKFHEVIEAMLKAKARLEQEAFL